MLGDLLELLQWGTSIDRKVSARTRGQLEVTPQDRGTHARIDLVEDDLTLLSRDLMLITITVRRSGRRYTFPVGYRQDGDQLLISVGWPERKRWWRNLRDAGRVEMRIRGKRRTGLGLARGDDRTGVTVEVQLD